MLNGLIIGICDDEQKSIDITKEYCEKVSQEIAIEFVFYSSYREIEEVVAVKENYTIDEMSAELENLNGKIYINDDADEVTFEDVEVVYYEDSAPYSDNPTIQPIYKVKGSNKKNGKEIDDYYGLTSAVKR